VGGCGILLFAAVWLVVPLVLRRGLAPLDRLAAEVARIEAHSLDARLPVDALPAELRPVGDRLNDLLARLAASFERERRFSADLAHELRTPLAELRSQAECALKWPESRDPRTDQDTLAIATQMENLVTQMLALSRGERGEVPVQSQEVEPAALVEGVWKTHASRAADRALKARFVFEPGCVQADPALLRSILHNLLQNAADYAPANGELRVTGKKLNGGYRIQIANPAGELTADDVGQLFDRFWRKEAARSDGKHAGLGLSVSRAFATAMDWQLDAAIDPNGWLVFTLETQPGGPSLSP
jgi:two-component system sensor histidine kinase QseC